MAKPFEPRVVALGVDALSIGVRGVLPRALYAELERLQADRDGDRRVELGGEGWIVERGTQWAMARLVREDLVALVTHNAETLNNAELVFDFKAAAIWQDGLRGCWERARRIAAKLMRHEPRAFLTSRLDLACDVETDEIAGVTIGEWIGEWRSQGTHGEYEQRAKSGRTTSFTFGSRKNKERPHARVYDKPEELKKSRKTWLIDVWNEGGWSGGPVWRVEFELHRPWLKCQKGVNRATGEVLEHVTTETLAGLEALIPDLWTRLTRWLQLKRRGGHKNRSRWEQRPTWGAVQAADWSRVVEGAGVGSVHVKQRAADEDKLVAQAGGTITTMQACAGIEDLDEYLTRLARKIRDKDAAKGTTREIEVANRAATRNADLAWSRPCAQASASECKSADSNPAQASAKSETSA